MRYFSIFIFSLLIATAARGQNTARIIDWKLLGKVTFKDTYNKQLEAWYLIPQFDEKIKSLEGKQVIIKGYIIPLDAAGNYYALSAYPFSACFFCGGAGPESVMQLHFENPPKRYKTDEVIQLSGILALNKDGLEDFTYILNQAKPLK